MKTLLAVLAFLVAIPVAQADEEGEGSSSTGVCIRLETGERQCG